MQYERYEQKIAKIVDFLKRLYRNKIKILIVFSFMVISVGVLLGFKGTIVNAGEVPEEITYGEHHNFEEKANAFLSDVYFEYCAKGENVWSKNFPTKPGDYKARVASESLFGTRYGEEHKFRLLPKDVTVTIDNPTRTYGEGRELDISGLVIGDTLRCTDFIKEGKLTVPNKNKIKITNENNEDVTALYNIIVIGQEEKIKNRPITITLDGGKKTYDGTPLTASGKYSITSGTLASGDKLTLTVNSTSITNVGTVNVSASYRIRNADGIDVTSYYKVNFNDAELTVTKRSITITTDSANLTYNGNYQYKKSATASSELVSGQRVEYTNWNSIIDVGEEKNTCTAKIYSGTKDVTSNYSITYKYGTLSLSPLSLKITTPTDSTVYTGSEFSNYKFTISGGSLAGGDKAVAQSYTKVTDVGTYKNSITIKVTDPDRSNKDVTGNYIITTTEGTLTITKRSVTLRTESYNRVYDGMEHNLGEALERVSGSLCTGHTARGSGAVYKNVVDKENSFTIKIYDNSGKDVTGNYNITPIYGWVKITKRPITVKTEDYSAEYDGKEHILNAVSTLSGSLCYGHAFYANDTAAKFQNVTGGNVENRFEFFIKDSSGANVTSNYQITTRYGTVNIRQRTITVKTQDYNAEYDGNWHNLNSAEDVYGKLCEGHKLVCPDSKFKELTSGTENKFNVRIEDAKGKDVTGNYNITMRYGTVVITKRNISLEAESREEPYTGEEYNFNGINIKSGTLCNGHRIVPTSKNTYKDPVTNAVNHVEFYIADASGQSVDKYYNIDYKDGLVTITEAYIVVKSADYKATYDGKEHTANTVSVIGGALCKGHSIKITSQDTAYKNVYSGKNNVSFIIVDKSGNNASSFYDITFTQGDIEIAPREITVKTNGYIAEYDGKNHTVSGAKVIAGTLCEGHSLVTGGQRVVCNPITDAKNTSVSFYVANELGRNDNSNYDITTEYGEINITPRRISIKTQSYDGPHDKNGLNLNGYEITYGSLCEGHSIVAPDSIWRNMVINAENRFAVKIKDGNGYDVTSYYDISYEYGTVTIGARGVIEILIYEKSFTYDGMTHSYNSDEYVLISAPAGARFVMHSINISLKDVGKITLSQVQSNLKTYLSFSVYESGSYTDMSEYYQIKLRAADGSSSSDLLTINQRAIQITTGSATKKDDGEPLTYNEFHISFGSLADGEKISLDVIGSCVTVGTEVQNTVNMESLTITNSKGNNTTENYKVEFVLGTLLIEEDN